MPNKNDFTKDSVKEKSRYCLWILARPHLAAKLPSNPYKYYSYRTKPNGGLDSLIALGIKRDPDCYLVILYDNSIESSNPKDKEIRRWENGPIPANLLKRK